MVFSPRGDVLAAGSSDGSVRLYDAGTGQQLAELEPHVGFVKSVAFSADGRVLAAGGGRYAPLEAGVQLWDVATRAPLLRLGDFKDAVQAVALSPDGALLAVGTGDGWGSLGSGTVWNASTGERLAELSAAGAPPPRALAFNPRGTLLAAIDAAGKAWLWHVADWTVARILVGSAGWG